MVKEEILLQFKTEIGDAKRRIDELEGRMDDANDTAQEGSRLNAKAMAGWAAAVGGVILAYKGLKAATSFVSTSVQEFAKFERAMSEVWTITDLSREAMHGYGREVQRFAMQYGVDATDTAKALYQTISAGIPQDSAMLVLSESMKFAKASLTDAADAVDLVTTVMNSYRLEADQAQAVSDSLFTTIRLGKTTGSELAGSLGRVVPVAAAANVGLTDLNAAMVLLTRSGLSTEEAVTSLRALIQAVVAPSDGAAEAIERLGLSMFNEQALGTEGGIFRLLEELQEKSDGTVEELSELIPNIRGLLAALAAGAQLGDAGEVLDEYANSAGAVDDAISKMMEGLFFSFERIAASWDVLQQKVGEGFAALFGEDIGLFADNLADFVDQLDRVGDAYTGAIEAGKSEVEATAEAWEELRRVYEDTLGPQLDAALDKAGTKLGEWWGEIDWAGMFADMIVDLAQGLAQVGLSLYEGIALYVDRLGSEFGNWLNDWGNQQLDNIQAGLEMMLDYAVMKLEEWLDYLQAKWQAFLDWLRGSTELGDPLPSIDENGVPHGGQRRFQFGGQVYGDGGVDRIPAMLTQGEHVVRAPVAADPMVAGMLDALNQQGPAALHMHFPGVSREADARQIAPRAASGWRRFQTVGGIR